MCWGWIAACRQAASADGTGVVSARLPERLLSRSRSRADWTGLDGIGRDWTGLDGIGRDWTGLDGIGRDWTGLDGIGRDWTGLDGIGRDWTGLDGIGRDWSAPHSPVAALGGGVTYHPHRSETKALHTYGAPSSTRFGNFGSDPLTYGFESSRKTRDAFIRFTVDQA